MYKYHFNRSNSLSPSNINGTCYFFNSAHSSDCYGSCKDTIEILPGSSYVSYLDGTDAYCTKEQTYYGFSSYGIFEGEYNVSNLNNLCVYGNYSNWDTCMTPNQAKISKIYVTSTQTTSMGTSLVQAGSGLVHIGIQLMPYAIGFTIIMILFALFKNWGKLKTNRQLNRIKRQKIRRERAEIKKYRNK